MSGYLVKSEPVVLGVMAPPQVISFSYLTLDITGKSLAVYHDPERKNLAGTWNDLTPREIGFLKVLIERKGEPRTRNDILADMGEFHSDEGLLNKTLMMARTMIQELIGGDIDRVIKTEKGRGYSIFNPLMCQDDDIKQKVMGDFVFQQKRLYYQDVEISLTASEAIAVEMLFRIAGDIATARGGAYVTPHQMKRAGIKSPSHTMKCVRKKIAAATGRSDLDYITHTKDRGFSFHAYGRPKLSSVSP